MARRPKSNRQARRNGATISKAKLEGFGNLYAALDELPKATQRNTLKRANTKALTPVFEQVRDNVPVRDGKLKASVRIQSKVDKKAGSLTTSVLMGGPGAYHAPFVEFGTVRMAAQPTLRPAIDGNEQNVISSLRETMTIEIRKAAARRAKKLAKG